MYAFLELPSIGSFLYCCFTESTVAKMGEFVQDLASDGSTVVVHLTHNPKVENLNPSP